jgi:hypothetical protein
MSGFRSFVRQLGAQPGVQLNPLADQTDGVSPDNSDQVVAVIARLTRGRIDRPFRVNRSNFIAKTGLAESPRVNALNEAKLQLYEALENGAYEAVVQRLTSSAAAKLYAVVNFSGTPTGSAETVEFSTSPTAPTAGFSMYLMHNDCFNDGIKLALHADSTPLGGTPTPNTVMTLRVLDSKGVTLHEFTGSTESSAKDDFGKSLYLPDVAATLSNGSVELVVATGAQLPVTSNAYGRSLAGKDNFAVSPTLVCFTEGGTTYVNADYDRCVSALRNAITPFGYLISGGSQNVSLVAKAASFAIEANLPMKVDVPGNLAPEDAIDWALALNFDSHYLHFNWTPLEAEDPLNGGRAVWGAGGYQAGLACARNARINAKGFAPKNFPIAGKNYPLNRVAVRQLFKPEEQELSDLAKAQVNPVIYETYNGGGRFVFTDSLTSARTVVSYKKLQSVAEMSASMDNWVTLYSKELLQLPMKQYIKLMSAFMDILLADAQASDWLVPAKNLPGNAAYQFTVKASEVRPADLVLIDYYTSYDGVARQVIVQQTLVK